MTQETPVSSPETSTPRPAVRSTGSRPSPPLARTEATEGKKAAVMRFGSTPRGARLARRLVSQWLDEWGHPYHSETNHTVALITAELSANAVRHGRVPGRDFEVRLSRACGVLRIEVSDTRAAERPVPTDEPHIPSDASESGRGLFLVSQLAARWAVTPRRDGPGKTVWAEVPFAGGDDWNGRGRVP